MNSQVYLTPSAVMAEVDRVMSARWQWGSSDCCAAACDVFHALWGIDPMAELRGGYHDAISAYRIIRDWGGFPEMADAFARTACLTVSNGQTGDIGLSRPGDAGGPDGRAMLICIEPGAWAGKSELGYTVLNSAERCWRA